MIRSALLLYASLLAATCFACVAVAPTPPPAEAQDKPSLSTQAVCSPLANIKLVSAAFDPTSATGTPTGTDTFPNDRVIKSDIIAAAYNTGPSFFLTQLCTLKGIFVTATPDPWGYRNISDGTHYIAIPLALWTADGPIGLDQYMNRVFGPPLSWPVPPTDPEPPIYRLANPNDGGMTILAALAHEFGHAFWPDILVSPRGTLPKSSRFCNSILDAYWNGGPQTGIWTAFEDVDLNPADIPDDSSDTPLPSEPQAGEAKVLKLIQALERGRIARAHEILWRILAPSRPFPSLLGAFSANEQFVETFMLYTLLNAKTPLKSLPLKVLGDRVRDIPLELPNRRKLQRVLACFESLIPHS